MDTNQEPVVLELAPLPRERLGPFLLLGVEKDADAAQIEANWARRVIWARRNQTAVPLENINWAREVLNDPARRVRADVTSLNADTMARTLGRLQECYGTVAVAAGDDPELAAYVPPAEVPAPDAVRASLPPPALPEDLPGVPTLLRQLVQEPLDPWAIELPAESE